MLLAVAAASRLDADPVEPADVAASADQAPETPSANPLEGLIQRLFRRNPVDAPNGQEAGETPPPGGDRQQPATPDKQATRRVLDIHALNDPLLERALSHAREALADGKTRPAITNLQKLIAIPQDSLVPATGGRWGSIQRSAEDVIGELPESDRQIYREMYASAAEQLLRQAEASQSLEDLAQVTRRYFHTPAGHRAADRIGTLLLDRGNRRGAAWWFARLMDGQAPLTNSPGWQHKAAAAGVELSRQPGQFPGTSPAPDVQTDRTRRLAADWTTPFGSTNHHATVAESEPLLIPRWSLPITSHRAIEEQVLQLETDLTDSGRVCLPGAIPLAADGKVVFRTLQGLTVAEASSGRPLWTARENVSIENLLLGTPGEEPGHSVSAQRSRPIPAYHGSGAEMHPLTHLLYQDGIYGLLSTDGEQVFAIENHATLSYRQPGFFWRQQQTSDPFDRDWSSSRIAAYDLRTGRLNWQIGGTSRNEPLDPPLAGTGFLGAPVPEAEDLFVIGERDGTISLFVLNRGTGEAKWSLPLAVSSPKIDEDLVRRWWPALPAVSDDLVICPTNVGWLIAVDRLEHRIRWAVRYVEPRETETGMQGTAVASAGPLNSRWGPTAPLLEGDFVVFTPMELPDPRQGTSPLILCWRASTGELLWQRPKEQGLYILGVGEDRILSVGVDRVDCRDCRDGSRIWRAKLPADLGPPAGRGVITTGHFLLPLRSGSLLRIRLADGEIVDPWESADAMPLGNLVVSGEKLLSLTVHGLTCFSDRGSLQKEIASRRQKSPTDPVAAELEARISLSNHQPLQALAAIARATAGTDTEVRRLHELQRESLVRRLDAAPQDTEALELLEQHANSLEERVQVRHLQAERHRQRHELVEAFDVYWQMREEPHPELMTDGLTTRRFEVWLATRLRTLWQESAEPERQILDQKFEAATTAALVQGTEAQQRLARCLAFHPAALTLEQHLAGVALREGDAGQAEIRLLRLASAGLPSAEHLATLRSLARLAVETGRPQDAELYARQESGATGGKPGGDQPDWTNRPFSLQRLGSALRVTVAPAITVSSELPSFDRVRLEPNSALGRLRVVDAEREETLWEGPLRSQLQSFQSPSLGVDTIGSLLLVVHRGVLHAISVAKRELLWPAHPFAIQSSVAGYERNPAAERPRELQSAGGFVAWQGLRHFRTPTGMLAVARPEYLALHGRGTFSVLDPVTGETLWSRSGLPPRTMVHGTAELLYVIPPQPAEPFALHASDGSDVPLPELPRLVVHGIAVDQRGIITLESHSKFSVFGGRSRQTELGLVDPATGNSLWTLEFPDRTKFTQVGTRELLALDPEGSLSLVSLDTGQSISLPRVAPAQLREADRAYALADRERLYLLLNRSQRSGYYGGNELTTLPVSGRLLVYSRSQACWPGNVRLTCRNSCSISLASRPSCCSSLVATSSLAA